MKNKILEFIKETTLQEKLYFILLLLIMSFAFSIPFGYTYGKNILFISGIIYLFIFKKQDLSLFFSSKVVLVIMLFVITQLISLYWSEHVLDGIRELKDYFTKIIIPLYLIFVVLKKQDIKYVVTSFIFGMFVNEIISYLIYFDLFSTSFSEANHYPVGFLNHVTYALLVTFCSILLLDQVRSVSNNYIRFLYILFFITMTTNLVISGGRTGYVVYFVTLFTILFTYYRFSIKNLIIILIFPIVVFWASYKLDEGVQSRYSATLNAISEIGTNSNYDTSLGARIAMYGIAYNSLKNTTDYIFGFGIGDSYSELVKSQQELKTLKMHLFHVHNSFLWVFLNSGIFSLFLYLMIFYLIWNIKVKNKDIEFIKQILVINIFVAGFGSNVISMKESLYFFSLFLSIVLISAGNKEKTTSSDIDTTKRNYNDHK